MWHDQNMIFGVGPSNQKFGEMWVTDVCVTCRAGKSRPRVIGKFPMSHVTPEGIYTGWWFHTFFIFHDIWDNLSH